MNDERCVRDRVTAILTLAEDATPGEWQSASWNAHTILPKLWAEDELPPNERGPFTAIYTTKDEDAAFIVALHNDAPALLGRLLEALDTIDRLEALVAAKERVTQRILREQMSERTPRPRLNGGNE